MCGRHRLALSSIALYLHFICLSIHAENPSQTLLVLNIINSQTAVKFSEVYLLSHSSPWVQQAMATATNSDRTKATEATKESWVTLNFMQNFDKPVKCLVRQPHKKPINKDSTFVLSNQIYRYVAKAHDKKGGKNTFCAVFI